jgi:ATP10 protein
MKVKMVLFFSLIVANIFAQINKIFPNLEAENVSNKTVVLPSYTMGKYTIIGLAYSEKAEADLKTWYQPVYTRFIEKSGFMDQDYDVNIFFIPMFTGGKKSLKNAAISEFNKSNNKELNAYVLFYAGELDLYKETLKLDEADRPYFFLLDKSGKIIYTTKGKFSDEKMEAIEDLIN